MYSNARNKAGNSGDTSQSVGESGTEFETENSHKVERSKISFMKMIKEKEAAIESCEADIREANETIVESNAKIRLLVQEIIALKLMQEQKSNAEYLVQTMRKFLGDDEIIFKEISEVITNLAPEMAKALKQVSISQLKDVIVHALKSAIRADCPRNLHSSNDSDSPAIATTAPVVRIRNKYDAASIDIAALKETGISLTALPKDHDLKQTPKCNAKSLDRKALKSNRNFPLDKPGIILDDITLSSDGEGEMESEEIAKSFLSSIKSTEDIVEIDVTQEEGAGNPGITNGSHTTAVHDKRTSNIRKGFDPISSQFGKLAIKKMNLAQLPCDEDV